MLNKKLVKKFVHHNLKSVVNIEREDFYPFLHPVVKNYLPSLQKNSSSYAEVYPKDMIDFLKKQQEQEEFKEGDNIEVAFVGRSNVGKSSLINCVLSSQQTKVSKNPGKTNYLQFIYLPEACLSLVDCPGYGYADRPQKERKEWSKMLENYLVHNNFLKRLFILIDAEVGIGQLDEDCIKMCSYTELEFNIILTKIDKLKNKEDLTERIEKCKSIITKYTHYSPFVFLTSSKHNIGINELKCYLLFLNIMQNYQNNNFKI